MSFQHLDVEIDGPVATLWLNRPEKLNAMSADIWADIPTAVGQLAADPSIRALILAGRGEAFTVGIDVELLAGLVPSSPSQAVGSRHIYEKVRELQATVSSLADTRLPVLAAVDGYCLGAGMDLITACDIRLCTERSTFSIRETRMGLVADVGTLQRLPDIVGTGHTAELALTGGDFDAGYAKEIGLVNRVVADRDVLMKTAGELADAISANSPFVLDGIKRVLAANRGRSTAEALDYVAQWNAAYLLTNDLFEATSAYLQKRPPEFKGE